MSRARPLSLLAGRLLAVALMLMTGPALAASDLDRWFDGDLTPWLTETLATHPRFKGETVRVTVFDGEDEHPRPDLLSADLAAGLETALSGQSGLRVAWKPAPPDFRPGSTASELHCRPPEESYLIVVDTTRIRGQQVRVRVRVLDLGERSWVSGATRQWSGPLQARENGRLETSGVRDDLRGQRGLPFTAGQEDLLAAGLARNVACALLAHPADRPSLWVGAHKMESGVQSVATLVSQYLSRLGLVRRATSEAKADLVMNGERHVLGEGLAQVWIGLAPGQSVDEMPSIRASAYATTSPSDRSPAPSPIQPGPAALGEVRSVLLKRRCAGGSCESPLQPALQVRNVGIQRLEILMVLGDGRLQRLDSQRCGPGPVAADGNLVHVPLPSTPGDERLMVFAIGAKTTRAADALAAGIATVPANCDPMRLQDAAARARLRALQRDLDDFADQIVWRGLRTPSPDDIRMAGSP